MDNNVRQTEIGKLFLSYTHTRHNLGKKKKVFRGHSSEIFRQFSFFSRQKNVYYSRLQKFGQEIFVHIQFVPLSMQRILYYTFRPFLGWDITTIFSLEMKRKEKVSGNADKQIISKPSGQF